MPAQANEPVPKSVDSLVKQPVPAQPATTVEQWQAQIAQSLVQVTGVALEPTETGFNLVLNASAPLTVPTTRVEGNALIAEIDNAVLTEPFEQANPTAEIAQVQVVPLEGDRIQVTITGVEGPPTAEISAVETGLSVAVTAGAGPTAEEEEEVEITVTAEREEEGGYRAPNSTVGTRTDTPIKDVPQSIQVIPRQVIEDQGADTLAEVLRNVDGGGSRGFDRGIFTDGATRANNNFRSIPNLGNVEQVEVLDGPASVLYGQGGPGGVVNLTTKQPLAEPFYEVEGSIGNYDDYRGNVDLTGPLNERKSILYRLNINYENSGSFINFVDNEEFAVFPVVSFQLGENTELVLEGSYETQQTTEPVGLPTLGTIFDNPLGAVPRSRFLGEPDNEFNSTAIKFGYRFEHRFNEDWAVRNRFRASLVDFSNQGIRADSLEADNRTVIGGGFDSETDDELYTIQTEVLGKVQTGIVQHDLLLGLELQRSIERSLAKFTEETRSIDLFDPEYFSESEFDDFFAGVAPSFDDIFTLDTIGVYAQNLMSIGKQVRILLGGRFDQIFQNSEDNLTGTSDYGEASAFSPRVGIVYQPIEPVSLYASWSRSFEPNIGRDREGNPFVPTTGEQFEVGVKTELLDGKLAANLSAYQITRQNDFLPDPVDDNFEVQIGEQRSRGIELDVTGEPLPGLRLIAGYAYTDARITEGTLETDGNQSSDVPEHQFNLWAVYEVQSGALEGLGLGTGVFFVGDRFSDPENTSTLPSYWLTNALIYYRRDNWRVQLNFENLFDNEYFENSGRYGQPFTIRGRVSVKF
jgi:iron complex outermembrane recepter protein